MDQRILRKAIYAITIVSRYAILGHGEFYKSEVMFHFLDAIKKRNQLKIRMRNFHNRMTNIQTSWRSLKA